MLRFVRAKAWITVFTAIDLKATTIKIRDNGANFVLVTIGNGDLNYTERRNLEYVLNLGSLDDVVENDEVPVDVRMDFTWEYLSSPSAGTPSPSDAFKQLNLAASWVSTDADTCRPFAVDLEVQYTPACTDNDKETITLPDFRHEELDQQLRNKTISCSGKCNVTQADAVRVPQ